MTSKEGLSTQPLPVFSGRFLEGNTRVMPGAIMTWLATGESTGGQFAMFEAKALPGFEPPPHTHLNEDETYYILEGELWLKVGDKEITARKGDFVFLPKNVQHEFKIMSNMLHCHVGLYPAGLEEYFIELTQPATTPDIPPVSSAPPPPEVMAKMAELDKQFGVIYE